MNKLLFSLAFMILIGALVIGGIYIYEEKPFSFTDSDSINKLQGRQSNQLTWNNIALEDSTVFNADGSCTGTKYGMKVVINPCTIQSVYPVDLTQYVSFNWTGTNAHNISAIFVYEGQLENAKMYSQQMDSVGYQEFKPYNITVNNYLVNNVLSYQSLGTPTQCDVGSIYNTQSYNVTFNQEGIYRNRIYCFSSVTPVNATAFRISGNATLINNSFSYRNELAYTNDVSNRVSDITNLVPTQMRKNFTFYQVNNIEFQTGQQINTKWVYTPRDRIGKWHILLYDATADSLIDAIQNDRYLYVDPFWTAVQPSVYFKFNESGISDVATDSSGNGYTYHVNPTYGNRSLGKLGNSSLIKGYTTGQLAWTGSLGQAVNLSTNNFTVAFWFKMANDGCGDGTMGGQTYNGGGFDLVCGNTGDKLIWRDQVDKYTSTSDVADGNWKRIVFVRRTGVMTLYINNISDGTGGVSYTDNIYEATNFSWWNSGASPSAYYIDDFLIYNNYSWTNAEIASDYNNGTGREMDYENPITDTEYPIFSLNNTNPANNTVYVLGANYSFNITINRTNGTAGIQFNNVNYSLSNLSTIFNKTLSDLAGGTYSYYYFAYGNGTSHNYNTSQTYYYTVAKATPSLSVTISPSNQIIQGVESTATGLGCTQVTCILYRNDSNVSNPDVQTLGDGNYTYIYNTTGNTNYTSATSINYLNVTTFVSDVPQYANLVVSPSNGSSYNSTVTHKFNSTWIDTGGNATVTATLTFNGVNYTASNTSTVYNVSISSLSVGTYPYYWYAVDNGGNSNVTSTFYYTIVKADPVVTLSITPSLAIQNGTQSIATCSVSAGTAVLTRNAVSVSNPDIQNLSVGSYAYNCSVVSSSNYNAASSNQTLVVSPIAYGGTNGSINFTTGNLSQTINFQVPYTFVTNAFMNLSNIGYCYQETANVSTSCGGLSTGSYTPTTGYELFIDGNWDNGVYTSTPNFIINYTIPSNANLSQSIWQIRTDMTSYDSSNGYSNFSLSSCSAIGNAVIFNVTYSTSKLLLTCRNSTGEVELALSGYTNIGSNLTNLWEEGMYWSMPTNISTVTNLNVTIGNNQIYNYPNNFTQVNNRTQNFYSQLNSYLSTCTYIQGICYVPITFSSATPGSVMYSDVTINNLGNIENNVTYNSSVYETSNQLFRLNLSYDSSFYTLGTISLIYNGTSYTTSKTTSTNNAIVTRSIDIPLVSSQQVRQFYFSVNMFNGTSTTQFNTSIYNQTVVPLNLTYCTSPFTNKTLNFTTYDSDGNILNASLEATFDYYLGSGTVSKEYNYQLGANINQSQFVFCLNSNENVNYDGTVSYIADGYDRREYIVSDGIINTTLQSIPLYLGATADTDVVTIIVKDQNYNPLSNALVSVQEWNIGTNTYSNIGMLTTNNNGEGIVNLELYNVWYRAVVVYQGNIVEVTDVQKLSSTTWSITVSLDVENPYEIFDSITHGLVFDNSTNITTFTWVDTNSYVNQGCLIINNLTNLGYDEISQECISTVSGTINYQLANNGEYEVVGIIYLVDEYNVSQVSDVLYIRLGEPDLTATISDKSGVLSFVFVGTSAAVGIASSNPIFGALLLLVSVIVAGKIGWMNITVSFIWGLVSIVIIILFRLGKR